MKILIISCLLLILSSACYSQTEKIKLEVKGKNFPITVYNREGVIYIPLKPFAEALSLNYRLDEALGKIELSNNGNKLIITANNPFLIYFSESNHKTSLIQLPTSTYKIDNQVFIPTSYCLNILKDFLDDSLSFDNGNLLILNKNNTQATPDIKEAEKDANYDIKGISLDEKTNGTLVRIESKNKISVYSSSFGNGILTLLFKNSNIDTSKLNDYLGLGVIKKIESKNLKSYSEIKLFLRNDYTSYEVMNDPGSNDLLIALHNKVFNKTYNLNKAKDKWDFNVIIIDAGHGGKDSGTIGVGGIEEKNITLAIALKLGQIIHEKMKDVKIVFTRKTDKFIELYKRGQIANENKGKLFISIHCNATPHKPSSSNGFEIYLLRPGKTKEAISIAERENSVIKYEDNPARYKKLTDENFILVSMAQAAYMRYSEQFADLADKEMAKEVSEKPRGVKQAGFFVLVGASMPSVLIETGFLSNPKDAHYLNSKLGQTQISEGIFNAIKKFRSLYEKNLLSD